MELQKIICYKISNWCQYQSDLEKLIQMIGLLHIQILSLLLFIFHKNKTLQKDKLFNLLFWFLQYSNFRRNLEVENGITMSSWNGWYFWKNSKKLFQLRAQKWSGDGPLKEKTFEHIWQSKNRFQGFFETGFKNQRTNLRIFDNRLEKYLIFKASWMKCLYFQLFTKVRVNTVD